MIRYLDTGRNTLKASTLAAKFEKRIVGQGEAKEAFIEILDLYYSGVFNPSKPIASMLFLGPTGTGKTGVVEAFVEGLYGDVSRMLRVDCGEFQHGHEIARLVGSPPGYLGHRETHPYFTNASLLEARSDRTGREILPFTVILFDEIEKAGDTLWNLLLGILDKGILTTGTNEKVDMTKTVIVMTSNVGAGELADDKSLGFGTGPKIVNDEKLKTIAMAAVRRKFSPEFLNRLDQIIAFKTLTRDDLKQIRSLMLQKVQDRIILGSNNPFEFRVSNAGLEQLLDEGYDPRYNARHLSRSVEKNITKPLTRLLSTGQVLPGDIVVCDYTKATKRWQYVAIPRKNDSAKVAIAGGL